MTILTSAPGKLLLVGDYAVVYGGTAISLAVSRRAEVSAVARPDHSVLVSAPNLGGARILGKLGPCDVEWPQGLCPRDQGIADLVGGCVRSVSAARPEGSGMGVELVIDTRQQEGPTGEKLGIGSSAAATVAVCGALGALWQCEPRGRDWLWRCARDSHAGLQGGRGSGVDVATSIWGGAIRFARGTAPGAPEVLHIGPAPSTLQLIAVWTGVPTKTTEMLDAVAAFEQREPNRFGEVIGRLRDAGAEACQSWEHGDTEGLLDSIDACAAYLGELGQHAGIEVVSSAHRRITDLVHRVGGAYKPSGAGGGDMGIAACASRTQAQDVQKELAREGFFFFDVSMADTGFIERTQHVRV